MAVCGSGGIGRRARLRGVCFQRTGSSPVSRTKKYCRKGYIFCSIFLSKSQTWYIITARSVVDIISPLGCISSRISVYLSATWWYTRLKTRYARFQTDDMQFLRNWWYTRLRLDFYVRMWYNPPKEVILCQKTIYWYIKNNLQRK